jgi:flagellar basal body-associated protein FliL
LAYDAARHDRRECSNKVPAAVDAVWTACRRRVMRIARLQTSARWSINRPPSPTALRTLVKKKLIMAVAALVTIGGGAFWFTRPDPSKPEIKIEGQVYVLPKEFLVNLDEGRFAKVSVGLIISHHGGAADAGKAAAATEPPDGYGDLPQEAVVRAVITDALSDERAERLLSRRGRERLKKRIELRLERSTDVHAEDVFFTDLTVQ